MEHRDHLRIKVIIVESLDLRFEERNRIFGGALFQMRPAKVAVEFIDIVVLQDFAEVVELDFATEK